MKKQTVTKVNKVFAKIASLEKKLGNLQEEAVAALFLDYPKLKSLDISVENEYNDSEYYNQARLHGINGVELPSYLTGEIYDEEDNEEWKTCCMALEMTTDDISAIAEIIQGISDDYFSNVCYKGPIVRENYVKSKSKAS